MGEVKEGVEGYRCQVVVNGLANKLGYRRQVDYCGEDQDDYKAQLAWKVEQLLVNERAPKSDDELARFVKKGLCQCAKRIARDRNRRGSKLVNYAVTGSDWVRDEELLLPKPKLEDLVECSSVVSVIEERLTTRELYLATLLVLNDGNISKVHKDSGICQDKPTSFRNHVVKLRIKIRKIINQIQAFE